MEFCFYCSRFPTPGQAYLSFAERYGQRTFLRALERRLNAALAGGVGARPRRGIGGLCWKRQVFLVRGGCTPGNSRLWSWSPVGTVQDRLRRQPRRRLNAALVGEASARPRHGFLGTPAAWNFAFPSLKLHKTGVNCRKSMVPGWKTLAKQAILRYYGKVNGAGGLPRRPPG